MDIDAYYPDGLALLAAAAEARRVEQAGFAAAQVCVGSAVRRSKLAGLVDVERAWPL